MLFRNKKPKIKELRSYTQEVHKQIEEQQPKVNTISNYLERRKDQNGFGVDFEFTLRPRGTN